MRASRFGGYVFEIPTYAGILTGPHLSTLISRRPTRRIIVAPRESGDVTLVRLRGRYMFNIRHCRRRTRAGGLPAVRPRPSEPGPRQPAPARPSPVIRASQLRNPPPPKPEPSDTKRQLKASSGMVARACKKGLARKTRRRGWAGQRAGPGANNRGCTAGRRRWR